jgi:hypothetical protein
MLMRSWRMISSHDISLFSSAQVDSIDRELLHGLQSGPAEFRKR